MTHASVFSGIGGPEIAAEMLGWQNLFHCEINPFGRKVLKYWFPKAVSYEDITTTDFSKWRGKVDVLSGGFPCQPFSVAGKRQGTNDDRYLWPFMFKCIDQVQPTWVVCENVAGICSMVEQGQVDEMENQATMFNENNDIHRFKLTATFTLERICRDLESHEYEVQPLLIPACSVGAPHRRDRVFIIGYKVIADADSERRSGRSKTNRGKKNKIQATLFGKSEGFGNSLYVANTDSPRLQRRNDKNQERHKTTENRSVRFFSQNHDRAGCGRWDNFPSFSPVHRGNDGIPFPMDDLTISQAKWRNESLKAYGNAIVPQVIYEIFRAIDLVEKTAQ